MMAETRFLNVIGFFLFKVGVMGLLGNRGVECAIYAFVQSILEQIPILYVRVFVHILY